MKRILTLLLAAIMLASMLGACSGKSPAAPNKPTTKVEEATEAEKVTEPEKTTEKEPETENVNDQKEKTEENKKLKIGDTLTFGKYEQDNDTSNGKEEIEWIVLEIDGDKALVISKCGLDLQPYDTSYVPMSNTWEKCTLRAWLNDNFLKNAFSSDEQELIAATTVSADQNPEYETNPGNATNDKVFLLSITEVNKYFSSDEARKCASTVFAKEKDVYSDGEATCWWWLRSPGANEDHIVSVSSEGSINSFGLFFNNERTAVRPAMWISLDSGTF